MSASGAPIGALAPPGAPRRAVLLSMGPPASVTRSRSLNAIVFSFANVLIRSRGARPATLAAGAPSCRVCAKVGLLVVLFGHALAGDNGGTPPSSLPDAVGVASLGLGVAAAAIMGVAAVEHDGG